jgi:hypothetical protein
MGSVVAAGEGVEHGIRLRVSRRNWLEANSEGRRKQQRGFPKAQFPESHYSLLPFRPGPQSGGPDAGNQQMKKEGNWLVALR